MEYRLFQYCFPADPQLDDLNRFIAAHRIASISHHIVAGGQAPLLVFIVQTAGKPTAASPPGSKVDYKEVLPPEQFAIFDALRKARKIRADDEAIPAYTVFSNAQLADFVQSPPKTIADIAARSGVGAGRAEKHGPWVLRVLAGENAP